MEALTLLPGETSAKANQLVCVCKSFEFIYYCTVLEGPSALLQFTEQLQSPNLDLVGICCIIEKLIVILEREVLDEEFIMKVFCEAKLKAQIFGSTVILPRVHSRSDPQFIGRDVFYQKKVCIPYYQWLINNLSTRFSAHKEKVFRFQNRIPSHGAKMNLNDLINVMEPITSLLPFGSAEIEVQLKVSENIWDENYLKLQLTH